LKNREERENKRQRQVKGGKNTRASGSKRIRRKKPPEPISVKKTRNMGGKGGGEPGLKKENWRKKGEERAINIKRWAKFPEEKSKGKEYVKQTRMGTAHKAKRKRGEREDKGCKRNHPEGRKGGEPEYMKWGPEV